MSVEGSLDVQPHDKQAERLSCVIDVSYRGHFGRAYGPYKDIDYIGVMQPLHAAAAVICAAKGRAPEIMMANFHPNADVPAAMGLLLDYIDQPGDVRVVIGKGEEPQTLVADMGRYLADRGVRCTVVEGPLLVDVRTGALRRRAANQSYDDFVCAELDRPRYVACGGLRRIAEQWESRMLRGRAGFYGMPLIDMFSTGWADFTREGFKLLLADGTCRRRPKPPTGMGSVFAHLRTPAPLVEPPVPLNRDSFKAMVAQLKAQNSR